MAKTNTPTPLLQGTLDVLILKALTLQPLHGLGVADRIAQITSNAFVVQPGSLFPALHRMEEKGWLDASWGTSENNRKAKFYKLTVAGRKQLGVEAAEWNRVAVAMASALSSS
ncbi:MAG TPA: PadR family transcriptional regulator [Gemmatimonadaceae bacterium]|jgi:transcriptional regulator